MIIGIGCDICQISRFKDNYEKLAKRLLTENEYAIYSDFTSEKRKIEFLAGRFSAKEAVVKALDVPKLVKDIAAAAVLVLAIGAAVIGIIIFGPKIVTII